MSFGHGFSAALPPRRPKWPEREMSEVAMYDVLHDDLAVAPYFLRPIYDELAEELGEPPLGFPAECEFKWPDTPPPVIKPKPPVRVVRRRSPRAKKAVQKDA